MEQEGLRYTPEPFYRIQGFTVSSGFRGPLPSQPMYRRSGFSAPFAGEREQYHSRYPRWQRYGRCLLETRNFLAVDFEDVSTTDCLDRQDLEVLSPILNFHRNSRPAYRAMWFQSQACRQSSTYRCGFKKPLLPSGPKTTHISEKLSELSIIRITPPHMSSVRFLSLIETSNFFTLADRGI